MGSRTIRITREQLLKHPAFQEFPQHGESTARVGGTRIELVRDGDITRMGGCYHQIPLQVLPPFNLEAEPAALLYLITLTTGLLDGDGHVIDITARARSRAVVTGQSATRIHPAVDSFATQQWHLQVEDEACLVVLPGPTLPFQGSRFYQAGRVHLAPSGRLIWGDIWVAGRYDRGPLSERFQFERLVQDFEVRRAGRLVYRDCFRWDGPWSPGEVDWFFNGQLAGGSLFVGGPLPPRLNDPPPQISRSVFPLDNGEQCIRWCGHPTDVTADLVQVAMQIAGFWTDGPAAAPWLLTSRELTPNHWFLPITEMEVQRP